MTAVPTGCNLTMAQRPWTEFFQETYGPLDAIVGELLALDESHVSETREFRPPVFMWTREGVVNGRRFRLLGYRNSDREWQDIVAVMPI